MFNGHRLVLILGVVMNQDRSALEIIEEVERTSGVQLGVSGIYGQLQRLVKMGLLRAYYEKEAPDDGRPRRLYELTAEGRTVAGQVSDVWRAHRA